MRKQDKNLQKKQRKNLMRKDHKNLQKKQRKNLMRKQNKNLQKKQRKHLLRTQVNSGGIMKKIGLKYIKELVYGLILKT
jgi:hypothetical protein